MDTSYNSKSLHPLLPLLTLLFSALFLFPFSSFALEHNISFSAATTVDSVQVQNLTRGLAVTVPAGKTLRLTDEPNAIYSVEDNEYQIKIYPNPIQGTSTLSFYSPVSGQTRVDVLALDGRRIDGTVNNIEAGENLYKLSLPKGAYFIKITGSGFSYAVRVLSQRPNDYTTEISFTGNYGQTSNRQKSPAAATVSLYFNAGDRLLYKGYSGNNSNIITDIPSADKSMTFTFDECKDALGNHYATVKIGNQTWMVENLNTTKYLSGELITELKDDAAWKATTTGAYCDNSNNPEFAKIYGKLYNWYAVNDSRKIAPKGWHIPTAEEWKALEDYLGGNTVAGGKLKETGTQHWTSPNNAATNESGFSAIPAGWRNYEGVSLTPGTQAGWWTSTQASATQAVAKRIVFNLGTILTDQTRENQMGYAVRCIKDVITLPTLTTTAITAITQNSAMSGGTIIADGGAAITAKGVCWSTSPNPTIADNISNDGSGTGTYISSVSGLLASTTYYLKAYATNSYGTGYGNEISFTSSAPFVTAVVDVISPATGKIWMDRNLGAIRVATNSTDSLAYGYLFQWGRGTDGHEKRTSGTTSSLSTNDIPDHGDFIVVTKTPWDWRSPQNTSLWQGVNGINNPCPNGYRLPTQLELDAERLNWSNQNATGAFASILKLPMAGYRKENSGLIAGTIGGYWSSSVGGLVAKLLSFDNYDVSIGSNYRANGYSVRCIKDIGLIELPTLSTSSISMITSSSATCGGDIIKDGGASITALGVCWSTNPNPTIADDKTSEDTGSGIFTSLLTGLTANSTYYVRAYATNIVGTAYGNEVSFTTSQPPQGYYSSALNKSGATLKTTLYGIISNGYVTKSYDYLYTIYETSDKTADGKVWDMYSACSWTHGVKKCGSYSTVCDCYNREHSIPQSWFDSASPMVSDAFHIYPTDGKVNGQRSNYPFGECSSGSTLTNGKGRLGISTYPGYSGTVFEPVDEYKGDFARTYFYFATRYENIMTTIGGDSFNGTKYPAFPTWTKEMFMKWHRQDPVSQKEITRNDAVYAHQKNRNPFIDHPELAEYLWGNLVGSEWSTTIVKAPAELLVKFQINENEKIIRMISKGSPVQYSVFSISGQRLLIGTIDFGNDISLSALNSGVYQIQFELNSIKANKKIVIP